MAAWRRFIAGWWNGQSKDHPAAERTPTLAAVPVVAEQHEGVLQELSHRHAAGYLRSLSNPSARSEYQVLLGDTGEVLARGSADQFMHGLSAGGVGDGAHGFWAAFPRVLSEDERSHVIVRPTSGEGMLTAAASTLTRYEPVLHVAMDIVDNCNLRCPFCLYDYSNTRATHFMSEETLEAALRFLPYTRDGQFWFSCLHEPTLHPELMRFIDKVPDEYRRKLFFTTNLAKRMPLAFFEWLGRPAVDHINVSIESLEPALYERMRKGARHSIFMENWNHLLTAFAACEAPPRLRYIAMAYKSNLQELPRLVDYLLTERRAWQVQLRYTFPVPHIAPAFAAAEYLDESEWVWLREQLAHHPADRVVIMEAPRPAPPASPGDIAASEMKSDAVLKGRYMFRLSWDGTLRVVAVLARSRYEEIHEGTVLETDICKVGKPEDFLDSLAE